MALIFWSIALLSIGARYADQDAYNSDRYSVNPETSNQEATPILEPAVVGLLPPKNRPDPQYAQYRTEEYDLVAQRWMAWFTGVLCALTGVGIFLLWLTLRDTRKILLTTELATDAAKSAADAAWQTEETARRNAMQSNRPWLKLELTPNGPLKQLGHLGNIPLTVFLDNFGKRPALNVRMSWFFIQKRSIAPEVETAAAISAFARGIEMSPRTTIFPGRTTLEPSSYSNEVDPELPLAPGYFIFVVGYQAPGWEEEIFYTLEMYRLSVTSVRDDGCLDFSMHRMETSQRIT